MKKKILSFVLTLCFIIPCAFIISACGDTSPTEYTINFYVEQNQSYHSIKTPGNNEIVLPQDPTKDGYIFDGWYFDFGEWTNRLTATYLIDNPISENVSVYAKWAEVYTVSFRDKFGNRLYDESNNVIEDIEVANGKTILTSIPSPNVGESNEFVCWQLNGVDFDMSSPITGDITLTPKFQTKVFTIGFYDENNQLVATRTVRYGYDLEYEDMPIFPEKEGYYSSWDKDISVFYNIKESFDVHIVYQAIQYNIVLDYNGADNEGDRFFDVTYDQVVGTLPTPTKIGYTFAGWFYNDQQITDTTIWKIPKQVSIQARWNVITTKVTYKQYENSEVLAEVTYNYFGEIVNGSVPSVPAKTGYIGSWAKTNFDGILSDEVVLASYTAKTYTANLDYNGADGNNLENSIQLTFNNNLNLPTPTKTDYNFEGWYIGETKYTNDSIWTLDTTDEITFVAKWSIKDTGAIIVNSNNFEINGKSFAFEVGFDKLTLNAKLNNTTSELDLNGKFEVSTNATWKVYLTNNSGELSNEVSTNVVSLDNTTNVFYIQVTSASNEISRIYTVSINKNEMKTVEFYDRGTEVGTTTVEEGYSIEQSQFPIINDLEGWTFKGWALENESEIISNDYVITDNTKLEAVYESSTTISNGLEYQVVKGNATITGIGTCQDSNIVIPGMIDGKYIVTSIASNAFKNNEAITSVTIPNTIKQIKFNAFKGCKNLTNVIFEENSTLETLGDWAFKDCEKLQYLRLPKSLTKIDSYVVAGCNELQYYTIEDGGKYYSNYNAIIEKDSLTLVSACNKSSIDPQITKLGEYAFAGLTLPANLVIPANVQTIGQYCFYECKGLVNISFAKDSLFENVYTKAFAKCLDLKEVTFPGTESKNNNYNCGLVIFDGSTNIERIYNFDKTWFSAINNYDYIEKGGEILPNLQIFTINPNSNKLQSYPGYKIIVDKQGVLYWCHSTETELPEGIIEIGYTAFSSNTGDASGTPDKEKFTTIKLPASLQKISKYAFEGCKNLTTIIFAENSSLTTIETYAFSNCQKLSSIIIPKSVTKIEGWAFNNCNDIKIYIENTEVPSTWESKWNNNATYYLYSEAEPTIYGNFWHYVNGKAEEWVK